MTEPLDSQLTVEKTMPEPPRTKQQRRLALALSCMACLTIYVALSGPMAALHKKAQFKPLQSTIEVVFAPVVWLAKHRVEPLSSWLRAYVELFR